jgi:hypothetical protein
VRPEAGAVAARSTSARYESLRAAVLSGAVGAARRGLALLARSGMAAWAAHAGQVPEAPAGAPGLGPAPAVPPGPSVDTLVGILAGMVLACDRPP